MNTEELLKTRGYTHGDFTFNSEVTQNIKFAMKDNNWSKLPPFQKEALEMIAHKIGRILCGDPNFKDHWDDIAGYAKLVSDRIGA